MVLVIVSTLLQTCEIMLVLPCFEQIAISDGLADMT